MAVPFLIRSFSERRDVTVGAEGAKALRKVAPETRDAVPDLAQVLKGKDGYHAGGQ